MASPYSLHCGYTSVPMRVKHNSAVIIMMILFTLLVSAQTVTLKTGEQAQHNEPSGKKVAFKQQLSAEMDLYFGQGTYKFCFRLCP